MCGVSRDYRWYSECTLQKNTGGFLGRLLGAAADEPGPHKITIKIVQLCIKASHKDPDRTCGKVKDLTPGGTIKNVGYSEISGECPVCVEAARAVAKAVKETCFQTIWEDGFDVDPSDQNNMSSSRTSRESTDTIKPHKHKSDKKRSKK